MFNLARQFATPLLGGIGLVSTLIALLVAISFPGGITISGASAWVMAVFVVWIKGALGGWILLWFLL